MMMEDEALQREMAETSGKKIFSSAGAIRARGKAAKREARIEANRVEGPALDYDQVTALAAKKKKVKQMGGTNEHRYIRKERTVDPRFKYKANKKLQKAATEAAVEGQVELIERRRNKAKGIGAFKSKSRHKRRK